MLQIRLVSIFFVIIFVFVVFAPHRVFATQESVVLAKMPHTLGYNCVLWARSVEPRLPQGLYTPADKEVLINAQEPHAGAIAVTRESAAGHLAIVRGANETHVLIEDTNYIPGFLTTRSVLRESITGYITFDNDAVHYKDY